MNKVRPGAVKSLRRGGSVLAAQAVARGMPDAPWRAAQAGMRRRKRAHELEGLANGRRSRCRFSRKLTDWYACVQASLSGCTQGGGLMNANRAAAMARAAGTVHKRKRFRPATHGPRMCTCASVSARPRAAQDCARASAAAQPRTAQDCAHVQVLPPGRTRPKIAHAQAFPPSRAQPKTAHKRKRCRLAARGPRLRTRNRCRPAARSPGLRTRASAAAQPHAA